MNLKIDINAAKSQVSNKDNKKRLITVHGLPASGKTWFAQTFPKPYLITTDGNTAAFDINPTPLAKKHLIPTPAGVNMEVSGRDYVWGLVEALKADTEHETIILDLCEDVLAIINAYWCDKFQISHESELGYARGYHTIRGDYYHLIQTLKTMVTSGQKDVILLSHSSTDEKGITTSNLPDKVALKQEGYSDVVLYAFKDSEDKYWLQYHGDNPRAFNRHDKLKTHVYTFNTYEDYIKTQQ